MEVTRMNKGMLKTLKMAVLPLIMVSQTAEALADTMCMDGFRVFRVNGYVIGPKQLKIIKSDLTTNYVKELSETEVLKRIQKRVDGSKSTGSNTIANSTLARDILKSARAYGVDPFIFTALIEKESQFRVNAVGSGGDSGLTQFTTIAVKEVTYQYKKSDVGGAYKNLSSGFITQPRELNDYHTFMSSVPKSWSTKRDTFRSNHTYALAAGASLLKLYLALNNKVYIDALAAYNGGGTPGYADSVNNKAQNIELRCQSKEEMEQLADIVCDMTESTEGCQQMEQVILGSKNNNGVEI